MKATFRIYCPEVRVELDKLVREHDELMHPVDNDGWATDLPQHINPHQNFEWGKWTENSSILYVSGHRHALNSEGYRVMQALQVAEQEGKAGLLVYKTSKPEMHWYETIDDYILRAPLDERIDAYTQGKTHNDWGDLFADLAPMIGKTPAQIWAAHGRKEARTIMRALSLRPQD